MSDTPQKWFEKPLVAHYSALDFARTGLAIIFIMVCMSGITVYLHQQVDKIKDDTHTIEYVNMQQDDIYDVDNRIHIKAPDFIIDKILEFPIAYNKYDTHAYILRDSSPESNGARYLYVHNEKGFAITRYWGEEELELFRSHKHHDQVRDETTK